MALDNKIGKRFGKLIVIEQAESRKYFSTKANRIKPVTRWLCQCDCGNTTTVDANSLRIGHTTSCGCFAKELTIKRQTLPNNGGKLNHILRYYKRNAKRRQLSFELTDDQVLDLITLNCHYCNTLPEPFNGIDRKDNNKGYTLDNCLPACRICNTMKMDMSFDEFIQHAKRISQHHI